MKKNQTTEPYKERTIMRFFLSKIQKQKIYTTLESSKLEFKGQKKTYKPTHLIHNTDITNLSFVCQPDPPESNEYILSTINFESENSRKNMLNLLEKLKKIDIKQLKKYDELILKETDDNRFKILIVDRLTNNINLYSLISTVNSYASFTIKKYFKEKSFQYKVILSVWKCIKNLRKIGYKNIGITTKLVYIVQRNSNFGLKDVKTKFLEFCQNPLIKIEYKFNQFKKLLLADAKGEIGVKEIIDLKYISEPLCKKFENKSDSIKDHNSFILFLLEISLMTHHTEFLDDVDFKNGILSKRLESMINDPVILKMIYKAFEDRKVINGVYFTEENKDFDFLERFEEVENIDDIDFKTLDYHLLERGIMIVPRAKSLKFILSLKDKNLSLENLRLIAQNCVNVALLVDILKLVKSNLINLKSQIVIFRCVVYFIILFYEIIEGNGQIEILYEKLGNEFFKKFLAFSLYFYSELHENCGDVEIENLSKMICYSIKHFGGRVYEILNDCDEEFLGFLMDVSLDFYAFGRVLSIYHL